MHPAWRLGFNRRHLKVCAPDNDLTDIRGTWAWPEGAAVSGQREFDRKRPGSGVLRGQCPAPDDGGGALQGWDGQVDIGGIEDAVNLGKPPRTNRR